MFKTVERSQALSLTTRADNLGNIFHCVEFINHEGVKDYAMFKRLSSAMDFILSNFI